MSFSVDFSGKWLAALLPSLPKAPPQAADRCWKWLPSRLLAAAPTGAIPPGRTPASARSPGIPPYVAVPHASSVGLRPGYFGGSYLGTKTNPLEGDADPSAGHFKVRNLHLAAGITLGRSMLMPMTLDPVAKKSRSADGRPARWHAVLLGWGVRAVFKGVAAGRSGAVASYRAVSMARWKWFLTSAFSPCSARYRTWSVILGSLMSASHKSTALVTS